MLANSKVKILVVGGGGREHALCWKLAQSKQVEKIYCAPGNGGTALENKTENVNIDVNNFKTVADFAKEKQIDLTVIGPDNPLADGIVDFLEAQKIRVFGPTKAQARLEWSKIYAKQFMQSCGIPTAQFLTCQSFEEGLEQVKANKWTRIVKADGLALGKGVFVCNDEEETIAALAAIFKEDRFGNAGKVALLEERLAGPELSLLTLCDGKTIVPMPPCQDHKRRFDGDKGPNTGGMGAYSPVSLYELCKNEIQAQVLAPLQKALQEGRLAYKGVLYIGLMITENPSDHKNKYTPYILEFNARFGDPETQALLPRLESDLFEALWACAEGKLDQIKMMWSPKASCCVVAVAQSYPESSSKGEPITIGSINNDAVVFHAGTKLVNKELQTAGGRVLCSVGMAQTMEKASAEAYEALKAISFSSIAYRKDIAREAKCLSS